ncbi:MAG: hypothetical protein AAGH15_12270 [Myxococcota bacterium]
MLESRGVRAVVALLIVVSVLPFPAIEATLRPVFLVVFGIELALRVLVLVRLPRGRRAPDPRLEWAFVAVDVLALVSFLPLEGMVARPFLRALRLVRLLVLVRFVRERLGDVWSVLSRREQLQQLGLVTSSVLALSFVAAVLLTNLSVEHDYDGRPRDADDFWDRLWWSFRQVESPDNLVQDPTTSPLLGIVSLGLTIAGIFVFSYLVGIGANVVEQVVRAERRRRVGFRDHTVIAGPVHEVELLVREFVRMHAKNRGGGPFVPAPRIALLGAGEEPPSYLYDAEFRSVVYRAGDAADPEALDRVSADLARRALLLAQPGRDADARTLARLSAFRSENPEAACFVELLDDAHEAVAEAVAGDAGEVLAMARVLGLFLCHHLLVPQLEGLLAELLSADGHEMYTHHLGEGARERLRRRGGEVPFATLAAAAQRRGITLVAVFSGPDDAPPRWWLNPTVGDAGSVPWAELRGLAGVSRSAAALRELLDGLIEEGAPAPERVPEVDARWLAMDAETYAPPRDVLVLGHSQAVPALVSGLASFVPGVRVRVVVSSAEGEGRAAARRRRRLGLRGEAMARELPGGGRLELVEVGDGSLVDRAVEAARHERPSAVVFLADPGVASVEDVDARVVLRVLRFVAALEGARGMRLLVELDAEERGENLARDLGAVGATAPDLTLVSTEQIRAYFLVHAAFVPGVTDLYDALLREPGGELVFVPLADAVRDAAPTTFEALRQAYARRGAIPVALVGRDGSLRLSPRGDETLDPAEVAGVHCVVDRATVEGDFGAG